LPADSRYSVRSLLGVSEAAHGRRTTQTSKNSPGIGRRIADIPEEAARLCRSISEKSTGCRWILLLLLVVLAEEGAPSTRIVRRAFDWSAQKAHLETNLTKPTTAKQTTSRGLRLLSLLVLAKPKNVGTRARRLAKRGACAAVWLAEGICCRRSKSRFIRPKPTKRARRLLLRLCWIRAERVCITKQAAASRRLCLRGLTEETASRGTGLPAEGI